MKKGFSKKIKNLVIGTLVAGFFLLPISTVFQVDNTNKNIFEIRKNETLAQNSNDPWWWEGEFSSDKEHRVFGPFNTETECNADKTSKAVNWAQVQPCKQFKDKPTITPGTVTGTGSFGTADIKDSATLQGNTNTNQYNYSFKCGVGMFGFTLDGGSIGGCIANIFWIFWWVTSQVMHLGGRFLDYFIYYSTNSTSYEGAFVEKGWVVVRDLANLFFIIALLYVAFKVILNDSHSNVKKVVGMVVVMALLINFSLFATQVVIDASNILAKIFYNNITSKGPNGELINNPDGEKSISVGLVQKFNPQQIISKDQYESENGVYEFIFTTFILIIITGYCAYIFFSVATLFVARVISLWLAMIFSPIAFASKTVSFDVGRFGWKKWFSDLIDNAMLAPLFIFFLYLIVLFLDGAGSVLTYTGGEGIFKSVMHTIIPFMILAGLLMKAKQIAVDYAGDMGKTVQGIAAGVGTLAIGAGVGTVAWAGRSTLGYAARKASDSATKIDTYNKGRAAFDDKLEKWQKAGATGDAPTWEDHMKENNIKKVTKFDEFMAGAGGNRINKSMKTVAEVGHAQHVMDEMNKAAGIAQGTPESKISADKKLLRAQKFAEKEKGTIEAAVKKGTDGKKEIKLTATDGSKHTGINNLRTAQRQILTDKMINDAVTDISTGKVNKDIDLTLNKAGKKYVTDEVEKERKGATMFVTNDPDAKSKGYVDMQNNITQLGANRVEEILNVEREKIIEKLKTDPVKINDNFDRKLSSQGQNMMAEKLDITMTEAINVAVKAETDAKYKHIMDEAALAPGLGTQILAASRDGTYSLANLVSKIDKRDSLGTKLAGGLTNMVAGAIRTTLKGQNIDVNKGSQSFLTDLGTSLSGAMKKAGNIKLDLGGGGGGGGGGGHGGGHDDHGHGGGGGHH